jgi:putative spermidine/putrescine transport system substrate-binding protein
MRSGRLSRAVGVAVITLGTWWIAGAQAQEKVLVVSTYGGSMMDAAKEAYGVPFERETGWKINWVAEIPAQQFAKIKAMQDTGYIERDVMEVEGRNFFRARKVGYLEAIDLKAIETGGYLPEGIDTYGLGSNIWGFGLSWSTRKISPECYPKTWVDVWDVKRCPGRRGAFTDAWGNVEAALLADGVPGDKLYPLDVNRALRKYDEIKSHLVWWKGGAHFIQLLSDGEIDVGAPGLPSRAIVAEKKGAKVGQSWQHGLLSLERYVIVKGTKKKDMAMKFLAAVANPRNQATFAMHMSTGPANLKAYEFIPKEKQAELPTAPAFRDTVVYINNEWWAENAADVEEKWHGWKVK